MLCIDLIGPTEINSKTLLMWPGGESIMRCSQKVASYLVLSWQMDNWGHGAPCPLTRNFTFASKLQWNNLQFPTAAGWTCPALHQHYSFVSSFLAENLVEFNMLLKKRPKKCILKASRQIEVIDSLLSLIRMPHLCIFLMGELSCNIYITLTGLPHLNWNALWLNSKETKKWRDDPCKWICTLLHFCKYAPWL